MISTPKATLSLQALTSTVLEFMILKRLDLHNLYRDFLVLLLAICIMAAAAPVFASDGEPAEYNRRATATAQILAGITPNPPIPR